MLESIKEPIVLYDENECVLLYVIYRNYNLGQNKRNNF